MDTIVLEILILEDLRDKASAICEGFGISLQGAICLFLKRMVIENGLPFPATLPGGDRKSGRMVWAKKAPGNAVAQSEKVLAIPMPEDLRDKAYVVCEVLGISIQTAICMFLKRMVLVNDFPFAATLPRRVYKCERAVRAMKDLSDAAARNGTADMTLEEINAEIEEARAELAARENAK